MSIVNLFRITVFASIMLISHLLLITWAQDSPSNDTVIMMTASIVKEKPGGDFIGGWEPKKIVLKQGQKVTLRIKSLDLPHKLLIPAFGVKTPEINPGETKEVTFTPMKPGVFVGGCDIECGEFHHKMQVRFIVEPIEIWNKK